MQLNPNDEVTVLVDSDVFDQPIDRSIRWSVDSVDELDGTVWIRNAAGLMRNVHTFDVVPADEYSVEKTVIALWKRGSHLATADRSDCWAQIINWVEQMTTAIGQLERKVTTDGV